MRASSPRLADAVGIALGFLADRVFADPRRGHPVALHGAAVAALRAAVYRDSRVVGIGFTVVAVGAVALPTRLLQGRLRGPARTALTAAAVWIALGGTSLGGVGAEMAELLERGDLDGARRLLPSLCGRDPEVLDADGLARAACESIAENTSDAAVAPLVWAALFGPAGALGYRAANTLDSMVGYRTPEFARFGWASARFDDLVNIVPARFCGVVTAFAAPVVGGDPRDALRAWREDAGAHPSPNAGVVEATAAGALGITLGGRTEYAGGVEMRPRLGTGPSPRVADLRRAVRLSERVQAVSALAAALVAAAPWWRRPQSS